MFCIETSQVNVRETLRVNQE